MLIYIWACIWGFLSLSLLQSGEKQEQMTKRNQELQEEVNILYSLYREDKQL